MAASVLWSLIFFAGLALAQEAPQTASTESRETPVATEPEEPRPIRAADLVAQAESVSADLRRIEASIGPIDEQLEAIETGLSEAASHVADMWSQLEGVDPARVTLRPLDDLHGRCVRLEEQLDASMIPLESSWKELGDERQELSEIRDRWLLTRDTATPEDFPPELMQRIDAIIASIEATQGQLREQSERVAGVIDRVSNEQGVIAEAFERLDVVDEQVRQRAIVRDAEPLWRTSASTASTDRNEVDPESGLWLGAVVSYADERPGPFVLHLSVFVLLLLGSVALFRQSRGWPQDEPRFQTARSLVSMPLSLAVALSLVLAIWLYEAPPTVLRNVGTLLFLIPILRIGRELLGPTLRPWLYGTALLYVLDRLWRFAPDGSLVQRYLVLGVTILGVGLALLLLARWRDAALVGGAWSLARAGLSMATLILVASAMANIWGWFTLAQLFTGAVITSTFMAASMLVLYKAVAGLVEVVTGGGLGVTLRTREEDQTQVIKAILFFVGALAIFIWARRTLIEFRLYEPLTVELEAWLSTPVTVGSLEVSVGNVVTAVVILIATPFVSRIVRYALRLEFLPRVGVPASTAETVATLASYGVIAVGVLVAAAVAGFNTTQLTVVFGALGVGIGFGLQTVVNNFVSGLILMFEHQIKVGDWVETGQRSGKVVGIGLRASTIRTWDGAEVIVPNGDLLSKEVINWSLRDRKRRVEILVRVAYGSEPDQVLEILERVATLHERVLDTPAPFAQMIRFAESSLEFRLWAWTMIDDALKVSSDLHKAVNTELTAGGIIIAVPSQEVRLANPAEEAPPAP